MEWQRSYIEAALDLDARTGTKTIDLPKSAKLSELMLRYHAANAAGSPNRNNPIWKCIDKLEVLVDGSTVVKSLDGEELVALAFLNNKRVPYMEYNDEDSGTQWIDIPIHFGRHSRDLDYGLDCTRHLGPQLKLTFDNTETGFTSSDAFHATTTPIIHLLATQVLGAPGAFSKGYIKSHEIDTFSPTSNSQKKRIELPTGNKFRRIVVRSAINAWQLHQSLAYTFLDLNVGVSQPIKLYTEEWVADMVRKYGTITMHGRITLDATHRSFRFGMAHLLGVSGVGRTAAQGISSNGGSGAELSMAGVKFSDGTGVSANLLVQFDAHGHIFMGALEIPFDEPSDEFMLDSSKWTDVDLVLEAAASGIATILPTFYVVLEEVVP